MNLAAIISRRQGASPGGGGGGQPAPPYLASLVITGDSTAVVTHTTTAYNYTQFDQYGAPFAGAPGPFTYRSTTPSVAPINSVTGVASALTAGTTGITIETTNSRDQLVVSVPQTLTAQAQVATTVTVTPPSSTLAVPNTQQFTAVVYDQAALPNVISGATGTWASDTPAKATISAGGVAQAVATTTVPVNITFTSGSAVGTAQLAVSASSTVTAVTLFYNSVPLAAPYTTTLLFRTGTAYPFVAKDQDSNVLAGGTWSATSPSDFVIGSSSGSLTPATSAAGKATMITYTYTNGLTATCAGTALLPSTPIGSDRASTYTGNTTGANPFLANVAANSTVNTLYNSNRPSGSNTTGPSGSKYNGIDVNCITNDSSPARMHMGQPVFNMAFIPGPSTYPQLDSYIATPTGKRLWFLTIERFDPGFTMVGNPGGASAYKNAPWFLYQGGYSGRTGVEWTNGGSSRDIDMNVGPYSGSPAVIQGGGAQGVNPVAIGNITTEFSSGQYFLAVTLADTRSGNLVSARYWRKPLGTAIGTPLTKDAQVPNGIMEGPMVSLTTLPPAFQTVVRPMGANYNQSHPSEIDKQIAYWEVVDGTVYGDPYGLYPNEPTATLTGITGGTVQPGDLNKTVTLTGTNFTANSEPLFSNAGVKVQQITFTSATTLTIRVSLDSGVTPTIGTVLVYNAMTQLSTATQPFTVGAIVIPQAPTLSNATTVNNQTLTFPYMLNASGGVPESLTWRYRETAIGGAFIAGGTFTLVSPALGGPGNAQFILPKASTGYDVQAASTNAGGTSAYSSTVTGTTGAAATLISTGLAVDWNPDTGTDVTTDGAGVGSLVDTIASATLFQGTAAKKPILKLAVYNGHNCLRFTSASSQNLTANAVLSALNSLDGTLYLVAKNANNTPSANQRLFANYNFNGGSNVEGYFVNQSTGNTTVQVIWGKGGSNGNQGLTLSTAMTIASGPHQIATVFDHTTPAETPYFDGLATTAGGFAFVRQTTAPSLPSIGSDKGSANFWDGDFIRFLWYSTIHTPAQVAQNTAYLRGLYGLP